jgi:nicotinamidase/pyrazinamidase
MEALLLVDLQHDFLPGGALAVADGDAVIPVAQSLAPLYSLVLATQDWHPADHLSFAANHPGQAVGEVIDLDGLAQVLWPVHCVQGSAGAQLAIELERGALSQVFQKGQDARIDSYSGFFDNGKRKATGLEAYLRERGVTRLAVMGLATDYCVKFTALDAAELGYETTLIVDGCRGVELQPGDVERALAELERAGVTLRTSAEIVAQRS